MSKATMKAMHGVFRKVMHEHVVKVDTSTTSEKSMSEELIGEDVMREDVIVGNTVIMEDTNKDEAMVRGDISFRFPAKGKNLLGKDILRNEILTKNLRR